LVSGAAAGSPVCAQLKTFSAGTASTATYLDAKPIVNPMPKIPAHLHEECFTSCCVARFKIDAKGVHQVKLITSSGNADIDEITLSTLRRWKFKPAMLDGKPVPTTRRLRVEFEVD
jgi:TonB family protein